jgi:hypothetical protein
VANTYKVFATDNSFVELNYFYWHNEAIKFFCEWNSFDLFLLILDHLENQIFILENFFNVTVFDDRILASTTELLKISAHREKMEISFSRKATVT